MMTEFGSRMMIVGVSLKGDLPNHQCSDITESIAEACGLQCVPGATLCKYPYNGKGGVGYTFFQPITESFITWDVWTDIGGAYLVICSCKAFWATDVRHILESYGLKIVDIKHIELGLGH